MTIADQLTALEAARIDIRDAIRAQGASLPDGTPLAGYAGAIAAIESGESVALSTVIPLAPRVIATTSGKNASDTTSHVITLPAHLAGDLLLVEFGVDGAPDLSGISGWTVHLSQPQSSNITGIWLSKVAASSAETLTITTSAAEQSAWVARTIRGEGRPLHVEIGGLVGWTASATITPAQVSARWMDDGLWIWSIVGGQDGIATGSPSGWGAAETQQGTASSAGVSISSAVLRLAGAESGAGNATFSPATQASKAMIRVTEPHDEEPYVYDSAKYTGSSTDSHALTMPVHAAGDILVAIVAVDGTVAATLSAGWDVWHNETNTSYRAIFARKVAASSSETCTVSTTTEACSAHIIAVRGVDSAECATLQTTETSTPVSRCPRLTLSEARRAVWIAACARQTTAEAARGFPAGFARTSTLTGESGRPATAVCDIRDVRSELAPGPFLGAANTRATTAVIALWDSWDT